MRSKSLDQPSECIKPSRKRKAAEVIYFTLKMSVIRPFFRSFVCSIWNSGWGMMKSEASTVFKINK